MCKIERPNLGNMVYEFRKIEHRYRGKKCNCAIVTKKNVYCWLEQGKIVYITPKAFVASDKSRLGATVFITKKEAEEALEKYKKKVSKQENMTRRRENGS